MSTALAKLSYWPEESYLTVFGSTTSMMSHNLLDDDPLDQLVGHSYVRFQSSNMCVCSGLICALSVI
jgi:hypothetical protein